MMQGAWAQFNVSGPGFLPDENGTNLDAPQGGKKSPNLAAGTVVKDCAECPEMVVIPAGSFVMGSDRWADEKPPHKVTIQHFLMGKAPVTQKEWMDVMGGNPSHFSACGLECPIENISWKHVQEFLNRLNQKTGKRYRLPSEAEWEYAARAGTTTEWSFGSDVSRLGDYAWHAGNSGGKTQVVGQKLPNAFGLFDVHGNVWEWTQDCYHENYIGAPTDGRAWTQGCIGNQMVSRGGSWGSDHPAHLRSSSRSKKTADEWSRSGGFRLVRDM